MTASKKAATTAEDQQKIKEMICEILEIEEEEVTRTSLFKEDHGADSLRAIEILAALERAYGITIEQGELSRMVSLEAVYEVVDEKLLAG